MPGCAGCRTRRTRGGTASLCSGWGRRRSDAPRPGACAAPPGRRRGRPLRPPGRRRPRSHQTSPQRMGGFGTARGISFAVARVERDEVRGMMVIRSNQTAAALGLTLLLALLLAAPPNRRASAAPEDVQRDLVDVAGADEPHTPPALNRAIAFRYHVPRAARPSAALVLIPGLNSGPNSLDLISRALVTAYGPSLEVWAVALRSTQLQDRKGVEEALAYGNPDFALAYYYGKLPIDGQTFHLMQGPEVPYMAYWGVDVHLRDFRALVREIHARYPGLPVVLGGHSLGGIMAAAYAGYNFAELSGPGPASKQAAPDEVGGREISGLLFLDGMPLWI